MNISKKIASRLSGAAVGAAVVGLTVGVGVAAAYSGQTDGATLYVCPDLQNPTNVRLTVKGVFPANTDAGYLRAGPGGLEYLKEILIRRSLLDEDGGGDEDEVFAWVTFRDGDGGSRIQSTQEIKHHFEQPGPGEPCFT